MNSSITSNFTSMQSLEINESFEMASRFINETRENIFVTGNAGTGKTSFLKYIMDHSPKNIVVAAPTGIAALNAGGVTLHSLFQLPFAPFIPTEQYRAELTNTIRLNRTKLDIVRNMDVLVIDEISMVRCDVLDAIDTLLRSARRRHNIAFGGVQMLFIGDLNQLPPVAKNDEWQLLSQYYTSPYFFDSKVMADGHPICIEFTKIYRQKESSFIELLNKVRNNALAPKDIALLNNNYIANFDPPSEDNYITLTSHNARADKANQTKLESLNTPSRSYKAEIEGDFPEYLYPNDANLTLKVGAQVMFIKNDNAGRQYFNGKIGVIDSLNEENIVVDCKGDLITVGIDTWDNTRYNLATGSSTVQQEVVGSYSQFPLKLAWAITIHKSQGLTFDKVMVDAGFSFSSGQVYVALSRCTSLHGIVLLSRIDNNAILYDKRISEGVERLTFKGRLDEFLNESRLRYNLLLLEDLLNCGEAVKYANFISAEVRKWGDKFTAESQPWAEELKNFFVAQQTIVDKFMPSLQNLSSSGSNFEQNEALLKRVKDSLNYFVPIFSKAVENIRNHRISTELMEPSSKVNEYIHELFQMISLKLHLMEACLEQFDIITFLNAKTSFSPPKVKLSVYNNVGGKADSDNSYGILYQRLKKWRDNVASSINVPIYLLGNADTLKIIADYKPQNKQELTKVKGFGTAKVNRYGDEIIDIVLNYCEEFGIEPDRSEQFMEEKVPVKRVRKEKISKEKTEKIPTKMITYELWRNKKTIQEIATERTLAVGTIEGHLSQLIGSGHIDILEIMDANKLELISKFLKEHKDISVIDAKQKLPDEVTFTEIRSVMNHLGNG